MVKGGEEKDGTEDEGIFVADGTSEVLEEVLADIKRICFLRNGNIQMSKVSTLKLSVCVEGQFSCSSGDCIRMEERCDQVVLLVRASCIGEPVYC